LAKTDDALDTLALLDENEGLFARDMDGQLIRLQEATAADYNRDATLTIDGREITVKRAVPSTDSQGNILRDQQGHTIPRSTTILDAARQLFVRQPGDRNPIPVLCHQDHMRPAAVCRVCVVAVAKRGKGRPERKLLPACQHRVEDGMEVQTIKTSSAVRDSVKLLTELLVADHLHGDELARLSQSDAKGHSNELLALAADLGIQSSRVRPGERKTTREFSSPVIQVNHENCILCDRCVRGCDEVKENFVIGRTGKGYQTRIGFDLDQSMGESSCVSCGECMISCPTSALVFQREVASQESRPDGIPAAARNVTADELRRLHPLFEGIPHKFLEWNSGAVWLRDVQQGDALCREGDYGSTAFILLSGRYEISLQSRQSHVENHRAGGVWGWLGGITSRLVSGEGKPAAIRNDGSAALAADRPLSIRTPEDLILGEMTCMNHYPRSATVRALERGQVLEIRRNVLYMLQRNPTSRALLNRVYRERALTSHLQSLQFFQGISPQERQECIASLRDKVDLLKVEPGQVIFRQGERADDFYLIRLGFVKVTQMTQGQERVMNYLGPGSFFGEVGLLSGITDLIAEFVPAGFRGLRTATCTALDDVELVRIRGEQFRELCDRYPAVRQQLVEHAERILADDEAVRQAIGKPLGEFLEQGLFNAQRLLVLDLESCTRCDECTRACSDTHEGVTRLIRDGLRFDKFLVASSCRSCLDPYCLVGCPVDAIHRQKSLEIRIENHCIGCGQCASNCPYGNINMHGFPEQRDDPQRPGRKMAVVQQKATTCDLCSQVVGAGEDPSCVYACPHNAAFRMSGRELMTLVERDALHPDSR
jgi:CRP-like cAMP-binding protein/Fe-S-cluster-containing dehydrogenase component